MSRLDEVDLTLDLDKREYEHQLKAAQTRLLQLRLDLGAQTGQQEVGPPLCVLFEGWDAGGKGGAIKRLVGPLDPRHVRVAQYAAPTPDELRHHWLRRFWPPLPGWGDMSVLDRSWYGRVLVERVEGFATEEQWRRAYGEIRDFERTLADEGMLLLKFWLHVSHDEQLARFEARRDDPLKSWKLTDEDWRNRAKRAEYEAAIEDMLDETDRPCARWYVVPGESKRYARVFVVESVVRAVEDVMAGMGRTVPPAIGDG